MNQTISALICTAMAQIIFWCLTLTRAAQWNSVYFGSASLSMCETLFLGFCQLDSTSRQVGKQGSRVGIRRPSLKLYFKCSVTAGPRITLTWLPTNFISRRSSSCTVSFFTVKCFNKLIRSVIFLRKYIKFLLCKHVYSFEVLIKSLPRMLRRLLQVKLAAGTLRATWHSSA